MPWYPQLGGWRYAPSVAECAPFLPSEDRLDELQRQYPSRRREHLRQNEGTRLWRIALSEGRVQYATPRPDGDRPPPAPGASRKRRRSPSPESTPSESAELHDEDAPPSPKLPAVLEEDPPVASEVVPAESTPRHLAQADTELIRLPPLNADIDFPELLDRRVRIREAANFEKWVWGGPDAFLNAVPFIAGMLALMEQEDEAKLAAASLRAAYEAVTRSL